MKVYLNTTSNEDCSESYDDEDLDIFDSQICAGGERGKDTCQGDRYEQIQINNLKTKFY
jgi:plasma kallikrein